MTIELTQKELTFWHAYKKAMYFTETGDVDQPGSDCELDETFERESIIDCLAFYNRVACYLSDDEIEQAGHDFWLTRNGHGAGFWDGDWKDSDGSEFRADLLTQIANSFDNADFLSEDYIP